MTTEPIEVRRAALVKKVASALANYRSNPAITNETASDVVIELVLETAAEVCDRRAEEVWKSDWEPIRKACYEDAAEQIRDLISASERP